MEQLNSLISRIDAAMAVFASFMWGLPLLLLLIGGGLFFVAYSRLWPYRYIGHAIQVLRGRYDDPDAPGEITHFQALMTALSSTIGMGNIAGVAVAISLGGPGAVFWMWVSGLIGMATKFFTGTLAVLYRGRDSAGEIQGGPMYFIVEGLGKSWRPLAVLFSLAGLVGVLPLFNVNQLVQAFSDIVLAPQGVPTGRPTRMILGLVLMLITGVVVIGGLKRISKTAARLVPAMVILYFVAVLVILLAHWSVVPYYFGLILQDAFAAQHFHGDPFMGGMLGGLVLLGIRRGAFSNEAGIGTAPMAHGASQTNEPVREGLVSMLGPAIDTLVVCTLTALAILVTGVWQTSGSDGVSLTAAAFGAAIPGGVGKYVLMVCVATFSISSLFSYAYYGSKCLSFLIGAQRKHWYNYIYLVSIFVGAVFPLSTMINLADGFFAVMALPTMVAALALAPKVVAAAQDYAQRMKAAAQKL